ncbi:MAG: GMC family oxidoreductase N-terminal domain-containing protein [Myxococcales bacterium]|nr:GMC family oxidoreductase N-terminal domain-containing protein [Myxococcales bacterium]
MLDCDVVIVGSGAGGAPVAAELAEAGFDVVVLEEGSYYQTRDFTADASAAVRQLYRDGGATMAFGDPPVLYQEGRAVGGSTVINGGMSWRTPAHILDRWRKEAGLGADAMGWKVIPNLRNQVHCPGSNNCAFGCPTGAKQSALVSYIPRALHFGARLLSDVRVERITMHGKRATGIVGRVVGADGRPGHPSLSGPSWWWRRAARSRPRRCSRARACARRRGGWATTCRSTPTSS